MLRTVRQGWALVRSMNTSRFTADAMDRLGMICDASPTRSSIRRRASAAEFA